jgi:hypothetical protein
MVYQSGLRNSIEMVRSWLRLSLAWSEPRVYRDFLVWWRLSEKNYSLEVAGRRSLDVVLVRLASRYFSSIRRTGL